ncbi:MAG: nuclear transport factor 2 family protein [Thermoanaerobaculia bacterium]|nr:nuclear transport factor 2 family protein [Thermoanaerobaculia bacterium]
MTSLFPALLLLAALVPVPAPPATATDSAGPVAASAPTAASAPAAGDEAVHDALRALKATMSKALNERDLDTLVANVDPNVVFTTMNGDVCRGPEEIRAYFEKMMSGPGRIVKNVTVSFEADALTTLHGGDTGIAWGSSKDHYELMDGQTFDIKGRWSCTMVRSGDRWLIASFHYSANVFDNPILAKVKSFIARVGVAAAIGGLLLGFLLGRMTARRKAAV